MTINDGEGSGSLPNTDVEASKVIEGEVIPPSNEGAEGSSLDTNTGEAASSPEASKPDERKSLLDATRAALTKTDASAPSAEKPKSDASVTEGAAANPEGNGKPEANDDSKLPFHKHPRWQQVIAENRSLRGDADQYRTIQEFMTVQSLDPQETAEGMIIMGLMKNDPEKAYERLLPHMQRLAEFIGKALPDDLQAKVNEGLIEEEAAKETAKLRRQTEVATAHATQLENRNAAQAVARHTQGMKGAVDTWEAQQRKSDPDFGKKAAMVSREVRLMIATKGQPRSAGQAVEYAKAAYKTVTDELNGILPAPRKTSTAPAATHGSHAAKPVPKSFAEAVRIAAGQS